MFDINFQTFFFYYSRQGITFSSGHLHGNTNRIFFVKIMRAIIILYFDTFMYTSR